MLQHFFKRSAHYSHNIADQVLNLLLEILIRRYPALDITESVLMEWKMWPSYLGMTGR